MGVIPLSNARSKGRYLIVRIASESPVLLGRLTGLGIFPGTEIFMSQKVPALVIRAGETDVALEREVATEILVRALP